MRAYLDVVATCAALAFLLLIVGPAYQYAYEESFITTPALQISNTWRAAALPVGICLMALFALLRLVRVGDSGLVLRRAAVGRAAGCGVLAGARRGCGRSAISTWSFSLSAWSASASLPACRSPSRSGWRFSAIWR